MAGYMNDWVQTADLRNINLYRYDGNGQFTAIPFQIDKRRKINLRWNRNTLGNGFLAGVNVCEYGYFAEKNAPASPNDPLYGSTYVDPFISDILHDRDEIVFLFKDAGTLAAATTDWVSPGSTGTKRYEFILKDGVTGAKRFVYAFLWNQTPTDFDTTDYIQWTADDPLDPCSSDDPASCGTAESIVTGGLTGLNTVQVHFDGNWITDGLNVKEGSSAYGDFLNRIEYKMNGETEDTWSTQGNGRRFLGITDGQIRIIRGIQGAQSGQHTTKYEYIYPTQFETRSNLRVHPLAGSTLETRTNHDPNVAADSNGSVTTETYIWAEADTAHPFDKIDGQWTGSVVDSFDDWTEVASEVRGSPVWVFDEVKLAPASTRSYIYTDKSGQSRIGEFGRQWNEIGNTQDGFDNSGACNPGEDADGVATQLHFARFENIVYPQPLRSEGKVPGGSPSPQDFQDNKDKPVQAKINRQIKDQVPSPPPPPCGPTISAGNVGDGAVNLSLNTGGCDSSMGFRVYSATGSEPLSFRRDLGSATTMTDWKVIPGQTYRYAVSAYNTANDEGNLSAEVSVQVVDSTPPGIPSGVVGTPGDSIAVLNWNTNWESDIQGYNLYMSQSSGGPFSKSNGTPIPAGLDPEWTVAGLQNNQTYYFQVSSVDLSGNESGVSSTISVTPSQ